MSAGAKQALDALRKIPKEGACDKCPWTRKGQPDIDDATRAACEAGAWFCCHVNMGTCYGAVGVHRVAQRRTDSIAQSKRD